MSYHCAHITQHGWNHCAHIIQHGWNHCAHITQHGWRASTGNGQSIV